MLQDAGKEKTSPEVLAPRLLTLLGTKSCFPTTRVRL